MKKKQNNYFNIIFIIFFRFLKLFLDTYFFGCKCNDFKDVLSCVTFYFAILF